LNWHQIVLFYFFSINRKDYLTNMSVTQGGRTDFNGTVSVNNFASASASACLDLTSTTQGALLPRMNTTQQNNISTPATGLTIYNTSNNALSVYNGTSWNQSGQERVVISSQTVSVATPTITFSSIPQTFNHLELIVMGQFSGAAADGLMQVNGITTGTYDFEQLTANVNAPSGEIHTANTAWRFGYFAGTTNSSPGSSRTLLPFYTSTTFNKTIISSGGCNNQGTASVNNNYVGSNRATTAISSITLTANGNWIAGSQAILYGTN
jgi:hypothetical protein